MIKLYVFFIALLILCLYAATYIFYDEDFQLYAPKRKTELNCDFEKKLGEKEEFGVFPLISLPGSGNT